MNKLSKTPEGEPKRSTPEHFRARDLSVALTVRDLPRTLAWYRDVVGFYVDEEIESDGAVRWVRLLAGNVEIVLEQAVDDATATGAGVSLRVTTAQDVAALAERVESHGHAVEAEAADPDRGLRQIRITDPDGFTYVISSEAEAG